MRQLTLAVLVLCAAAAEPRRERRRERRRAVTDEHKCWEETTAGSFLETTAQAGARPASDADAWKKTYNWFYNDQLTPAGNFPNKWAPVAGVGLTGSESKPPRE